MKNNDIILGVSPWMSQLPRVSPDSPIKSMIPTEFATQLPAQSRDVNNRFSHSPFMKTQREEEILQTINVLEMEREKNYDLSLRIEMFSENLIKSEEANHTLRTYIVELEAQIALLKSGLGTHEQQIASNKVEVQELQLQLCREKQNQSTQKRLMEIQTQQYKDKILQLEQQVESLTTNISKVESQKAQLRVDIQLQQQAIEANQKQIISNTVLIQRLREEVSEIKSFSLNLSDHQQLKRVKSSEEFKLAIGTQTARKGEGNQKREVGRIFQKGGKGENGIGGSKKNEREIIAFHELIQRTKALGIAGRELERIHQIERQMYFIK